MEADSVDVPSYSINSLQQLEGLCTQIIYTNKALHLHYTSNTLPIPQPAYLQQHPKAEHITDQLSDDRHKVVTDIYYYDTGVW
jgi:hypothetical protein